MSGLIDMSEQTLDWFYDRTLQGIPGWSPIPDFVDQRKADCPNKSSRQLSRWHASRAGAFGFVSGFGGFVTLPLSLSVGIFTELYLQARLTTCIAHVYGHDITEDETKAKVFSCLGIATESTAATNGHLREKAIKEVFSEVVVRSNKWVFSKVGSAVGGKSIGHLSRAIPIAGSVATASTGAYGVYKVGKKAQEAFSH